jgi:hypothetical protein
MAVYRRAWDKAKPLSNSRTIAGSVGAATATIAGAVVEVEGSLRRRFWRSGAGLGSALEVDVDRITPA